MCWVLLSTWDAKKKRSVLGSEEVRPPLVGRNLSVSSLRRSLGTLVSPNLSHLSVKLVCMEERPWLV